MQISERETKVLEVLADYFDAEGNCLYFKTIGKLSGIEPDLVRRVTRSLARKGLAEYVRGLFDDEGMVAGSGYCCTRLGKETFDNLVK